MTQKIHFCRPADGAGFAYALLSQDPPLAKTADYLTCLEYDWTQPRLTALASGARSASKELKFP